MGVYDFDEMLALSNSPKVRRMIETALKSRFDNLLAIHKAHVVNDKRGIDYFLEFPHGKIETLDVKVRTKDFARQADGCNLAIENQSNVRKSSPGWTVDCDKLTDWVLWIWVDTERSELIHFRQARLAATRSLPDWMASRKVATQTTPTVGGSYDSQSVFISTRDLWAAVFRGFSYGPVDPNTPPKSGDTDS
jgi:hypothetical protein